MPSNPGGVSETFLRNWLADRGTRTQIVLATKVGSWDARPGLERSNVDAALDESLKRLQTDYIDIDYAHCDDQSVSIIEQVRIFHDLVASGRVKHVALSNYSPERMREWFVTAQREGLTVPVAIQPLYSLLERRSFEQGYAQIARDFDAAVFPYYPLASGFLAGKYRVPGDLERYPRGATIRKYLTAAGLGVVEALDEIAAVRGRPASVAWRGCWLRA